MKSVCNHEWPGIGERGTTVYSFLMQELGEQQIIPAGPCSKQRKGHVCCVDKYLSSGRNLWLQDVTDAKILVEFQRGLYNVFCSK